MANDPQRELWREARRHIGEYESRSSELNLDLHAAKKELSAAEEELASLRRDTRSQQIAKDASDREALDEHDKLQALQRRRDDELAESSRLTLQLASLQEELEAARIKAAEEGRQREAHLVEMRAHLERLLSYSTMTKTTVAQQQGPAAGQMPALEAGDCADVSGLDAGGDDGGAAPPTLTSAEDPAVGAACDTAV